MIAVRQHQARRQRVHSTMGKREQPAAKAEHRDHGVVGDGAERKDRAEPRHGGDLGGEELAASGDLAKLRPVLRRHATDRIGNARSAKREAVIGAGSIITFRKAEFA